MEFSRQECWSGLPLPFPGIFPIQGSNLHIVGRQILSHRATWSGLLNAWLEWSQMKSFRISKILVWSKLSGYMFPEIQRVISIFHVFTGYWGAILNTMLLYRDFLVSCLKSFSCSRMPSKAHITVHCSVCLDFPCLWQFLRLFLYFMTLTGSVQVNYFVKCLSIEICVIFF